MSDGSGSPRSTGGASMQSSMMTTKQYFLVNLSKFIVEIVGTAVLGIFYLMMGDKQVGLLLGMWVVTLFGVAISGAHFNPCITLVAMLRKNSTFGSRRLLGIIYIVAQFIGGILAASLARYLLHNSADHNNIAVSPMLKVVDDKFEYRNFSSLVSEVAGTAYYVFLIMICTDKKTQFSEDKVINCFIMSSSYIASRLMAGGIMVTGLYLGAEIQAENGDLQSRGVGIMTGPLLNPALAFGQMALSGEFQFIFQYLLMPFIGSAIALVFYEFVFVKSQEYLAEGDDSSTGSNRDLALPDGLDSPPEPKKQLKEDKHIDEDEEETNN